MKIIKRGKVKEKIREKVCWKCDSKLEYKPKDVKCDRDGRYIVCPVCKHFIGV